MTRTTNLVTHGAGRALVLVILMVGCNDRGPVPSPTPVAGTMGHRGTATVSGTVYEHRASGARPLAGFRFTLRASTNPWVYRDQEVTSDAGGHYVFSAAIGTNLVVQIPADAGYHAPCPAGLERILDDANVDVHLVLDSVLTSTGMPESVPTWIPRVSGVVSLQVLDGPEVHGLPLVGASVELVRSPGGLGNSITLTDGEGRYVLCASPPGTGEGQSAWLAVTRDRRVLAFEPLIITGNDVRSFVVGNGWYWDY